MSLAVYCCAPLELCGATSLYERMHHAVPARYPTFFSFSFFLPLFVSVVCLTGPHPPLRLARRPNRGHIRRGGVDPLLLYMPMMFLSRVGSTARRYHVCAGTKQKQVHLHIPKSALVRILQPKQWVDRRSAVRSRIRKPFALHTETSQGAGAGVKLSPPTCLHVHYNYNYQRILESS